MPAWLHCLQQYLSSESGSVNSTHATFSRGLRVPAYWPLIIGIVVFACGSLVSIFTRLPWIDERFVAEPAIHMLEGKPMTVTFYEPIDPYQERFDQYTYWMPPVWFFIEAGWFAIAGSSLVSLRFLTCLFGGINLLAVYLLSKKICGKPTAYWVVFFTGTQFLFVAHAADGRMDMMVSAVSVLGIVTYLNMRARHPKAAWLVSHSLLVLGGLANPVAIVSWCVLVCIQIWYERFRPPMRCIGIAGIPYVVGAFAWGCYVFRDFSAFKDQFFSKLLKPEPFFDNFRDEVVMRYFHQFGIIVSHSSVEVRSKTACLALIGLIFPVVFSVYQALLRQHALAQRLITLWLIYFCALTILVPLKADYCIVQILPMYGMLAGYCYFYRGTATSEKLSPSLSFRRTICLIGTASSIHIMISNALADPFKNLYAPVAEVLAAAQPNERVCGPPEFRWAAAGIKPDVVCDRFYGFYSRKKPDWVILRPSDDPYKAPTGENGYRAYISGLFENTLQLVYSNEAFRVFHAKILSDKSPH